MRNLYELIIFAVILSVLTSCQLLFNPDFSNKSAIGGNTSTSLNPSGDVIGPGAPSISGTYNEYLSGYNIFVSIDGGTYTQASENYPNWTLNNINLKFGPHKVIVQLQDSGGNVKSSNIFVYNVPAYVAAYGNDSQAGNTPSAAFALLQTGANHVSNLTKGFVFAAAGTYSQGLDFSSAVYSNIVIQGGWINNFQSRNGTSVINLNGSGGYIFNLDGSLNITIDGITAENGGEIGNVSGVYINCSTNITLTNMIITGDLYGGIDLIGSLSNNISATVINNHPSSSQNGAGIGIYLGCTNAIINGIISNNYATSTGGGISVFKAYNTTINAMVANNNASTSGGGIYISYATNVIINGPVINNIATSGGGIFTNGLDYFNIVINGPVVDNTGGNIF